MSQWSCITKITDAPYIDGCVEGVVCVRGRGGGVRVTNGIMWEQIVNM